MFLSLLFALQAALISINLINTCSLQAIPWSFLVVPRDTSHMSPHTTVTIQSQWSMCPILNFFFHPFPNSPSVRWLGECSLPDLTLESKDVHAELSVVIGSSGYLPGEDDGLLPSYYCLWHKGPKDVLIPSTLLIFSGIVQLDMILISLHFRSSEAGSGEGWWVVIL